MDFYLKFIMGTMIRHQFLKLTMNRINFQETGHSAIHEQQQQNGGAPYCLKIKSLIQGGP